MISITFAQADILASLELDKVFLPVYDLQVSVWHHVPNVPGLKPPLASGVLERLGRGFIILPNRGA